MSRILLLQFKGVIYNPTNKSLITLSNLLTQENCSAVEMVYNAFENNICNTKPHIVAPKIDYPIKIEGRVNNLKVLQHLLSDPNLR
jgi:hypothetical protein